MKNNDTIVCQICGETCHACGNECNSPIADTVISKVRVKDVDGKIVVVEKTIPVYRCPYCENILY